MSYLKTHFLVDFKDFEDRRDFEHPYNKIYIFFSHKDVTLVKSTAITKVVYYYNNILFSSHKDVTLAEEHGHYQSGLLCYPSHGVLGLSSTNQSKSSFMVSWDFYPWDVYLIEYVSVQVFKTKVSEFQHSSPGCKLYGKWPNCLNLLEITSVDSW